MSYRADVRMLRRAPLTDGVLRFLPARPAQAGAPAIDRALVDVEPESGSHPGTLVERQRARVIGGDTQLGLTQPGARVGGERPPEHRRGDAAALVVRVNREDVDIADRLILPAAREDEAGEPARPNTRRS